MAVLCRLCDVSSRRRRAWLLVLLLLLLAMTGCASDPGTVALSPAAADLVRTAPGTVAVHYGIFRAGQAWPAVAVGFTKGEVWEYGTAP